MVELKGKVEVSRPRDEVFSIVTDFENWPKWWNAVQRVNFKGGPPEPGRVFGLVLRPHKMKLGLRLKILEIADQGCLVLAGKKWYMAVRIQWTVIKDHQNCRVEEIFSLGGPGLIFFRLLGQVEALGHMIRRNLNSLKNLAEADQADE